MVAVLYQRELESPTYYYKSPNEQAATHYPGQLLPSLNTPCHLVDEEPFVSSLQNIFLDMKKVNVGSGTLVECGFSKVFSRSCCYSRKDTII